MRHALLLVLLAGLGLSACDPAQPSTDVNQDRVYARYELRYDRDATRARASFRFGGPNGTLLILDGGAEVAFGGEPLRLVQLPANITYYEREVARDTDAGTFRYTDADGRTFENAAALPAPLDLADGIQISNDADTEVPFTGPPVGAGEVVSLAVFRIGQNSQLAVGEQRRVGAQSVTLPVASIRNAAPGDVTLALARVRSRPVDEGTSVGGEVVEVVEAPLRTGRIVD